jgi:ankyrin repeat protein
MPLEHSQDAVVQDLSKWVRLEYPNRGSAELARVLLENGANASAQDKNNSTPLHWASGCGLVELARVLLENGADASAQDKDKSTPLHRVSESGLVSFVRVLLQRVIQPSLHLGWQCAELAKLLLTHNADVSAQDNVKFSPLHLASGGAGYLGAFMEPQQLRDEISGLTELVALVALVRVLLTNGADVRARDKDNSTPLHWVSGGGYVKLARTPFEGMFDGSTDRLNLSDFEPDSGFLLNRGDVGRVYAEVARQLLNYGADADANVQDIFGLTPLQRAQRVGFPDVTQLLLSRTPT